MGHTDLFTIILMAGLQLAIVYGLIVCQAQVLLAAFLILTAQLFTSLMNLILQVLQ